MEEKIKKPRKKRLLKYSIEDMQAFAKAKGGKCLSDEYKGIMVKLQWQCKEGHNWFTVPNQIVSNKTWCPVCSKIKNGLNKRATIEKMNQVAKERGGKCLSKQYIDALHKIRWQCAEGHEWNATPGSVVHGTWCPVCGTKRAADMVRGNLEEFQRIALKNGGKCLSSEYINSFTELQWECNKGHLWMASPNNIKTGTWCPYCANNIKTSIEDLQLIAKKYDGKYLSKEYIPKKPLIWECAKGHVWERTLDNIKRRGWCSICRKEEKKAAKKLLQDSEKIV